MTHEIRTGDAYARAHRITALLCRMLCIRRDLTTAARIYDAVWYRTSGMIAEKSDADGLYPWAYRQGAPLHRDRHHVRGGGG